MVRKVSIIVLTSLNIILTSLIGCEPAKEPKIPLAIIRFETLLAENKINEIIVVNENLLTVYLKAEELNKPEYFQEATTKLGGKIDNLNNIEYFVNISSSKYLERLMIKLRSDSAFKMPRISHKN